MDGNSSCCPDHPPAALFQRLRAGDAGPGPAAITRLNAEDSTRSRKVGLSQVQVLEYDRNGRDCASVSRTGRAARRSRRRGTVPVTEPGRRWAAARRPPLHPAGHLEGLDAVGRHDRRQPGGPLHAAPRTSIPTPMGRTLAGPNPHLTARHQAIYVTRHVLPKACSPMTVTSARHPLTIAAAPSSSRARATSTYIPPAGAALSRREQAHARYADRRRKPRPGPALPYFDRCAAFSGSLAPVGLPAPGLRSVTACASAVAANPSGPGPPQRLAVGGAEAASQLDTMSAQQDARFDLDSFRATKLARAFRGASSWCTEAARNARLRPPGADRHLPRTSPGPPSMQKLFFVHDLERLRVHAVSRAGHHLRRPGGPPSPVWPPGAPPRRSALVEAPGPGAGLRTSRGRRSGKMPSPSSSRGTLWNSRSTLPCPSVSQLCAVKASMG